MKIRFKAIGLTFEADVLYTLPTRATIREPGDSGEIEFLSLTCDGKDATFLVDSPVFYDVEEGAWMGIMEARRREDNEFAAEAAWDK